MRRTLAIALTTALLAGSVVASQAYALPPGPGGFAPGGGGPPPPGPGFGGPGGFANPQPPGGGGGGGAWPMPPGGGWGGGWGGGFGLTIAPQIYTGPATRQVNAWEAHVDWCDDRWRSYDEDTNMYMSNKGPRVCVSPYSRYLQ